MRSIRIMLVTSALIAAAVLGLGTGSASAAMLYTTSAHTATVPVNTSFTTVSTTPITLFSGVTQVNSCNSATIHWVHAGSRLLGFVLRAVAAQLINCVNPTTANTTVPWTLTISGNGEASGVNTVFTNVVIDSVSVTFLGGTYTGNLTASSPGNPPVNGVYATQPTTAGAPICIVMTNAGTVVGPLTSAGHFTGTVCFSGSAASYSLGN